MSKMVALVGRTNVGKSTLFNRLIKKRFAVTSYTPQTTRDRLYADLSWNGQDFILVDTAGLNLDIKDEFKNIAKKIEYQIFSQVKEAISEADLIIFLTDAKDGLTDSDKEIADLLRKSAKPIILCVNKVDNQKQEERVSEFESFGFKDVVSVSAISGRKSGDLLDVIADKISKIKTSNKSKKSDLDIAILGRPNVGKSTLTNSLIGQNRLLVSEVPGTTIDTVDVFLNYEKQIIRFIDTAGIRRRGKIKTGVEKFSVLRALKSIARSDIVTLLIDASEGVTKQDMHIAQFVLEGGRGLILVVNKWDLVELEKDMNNFLNHLRNRVKFLPWSPVVFVSALKGKNVKKILDLALLIDQNRKLKISTRKINELIAKAVMENPPKAKGKYQPKIYFSSQVAVAPPMFVIKVNQPDLIHFSYLRYLERQIRQAFDFTGTPIKIELRSNSNNAKVKNQSAK